MGPDLALVALLPLSTPSAVRRGFNGPGFHNSLCSQIRWLTDVNGVTGSLSTHTYTHTTNTHTPYHAHLHHMHTHIHASHTQRERESDRDRDRAIYHSVSFQEQRR